MVQEESVKKRMFWKVSNNKPNKIRRKWFRRAFKMSFIVRILQVAFRGIIQEELCCKTLINSLPQVPKYFLK